MTTEELIADIGALYVQLGELRLELIELQSSIYTRQKAQDYEEGEQARHVLIMTECRIQITELSIETLELRLLRTYLQENYTISGEDLEAKYLVTSEDPSVKYESYRKE